MEYEDVLNKLIAFRNNRGWQKYHNLKDLAIALNLESSEFLKAFEWKQSDENISKTERDYLEKEIADVLIYSFYICDKLGKNPYDLINEKMKINEHRTWDTEEK